MLIQDEINTAMSCQIQIRTPMSTMTKKAALLKKKTAGTVSLHVKEGEEKI